MNTPLAPNLAGLSSPPVDAATEAGDANSPASPGGDIDDDLIQAYEYAEAIEIDLHSVAVALADWCAEHAYVVPEFHRAFHSLIEQYRCACASALYELAITEITAESPEDDSEQARRLI